MKISTHTKFYTLMLAVVVIASIQTFADNQQITEKHSLMKDGIPSNLSFKVGAGDTLVLHFQEVTGKVMVSLRFRYSTKVTETFNITEDIKFEKVFNVSSEVNIKFETDSIASFTVSAKVEHTLLTPLVKISIPSLLVLISFGSEFIIKKNIIESKYIREEVRSINPLGLLIPLLLMYTKLTKSYRNLVSGSSDRYASSQLSIFKAYSGFIGSFFEVYLLLAISLLFSRIINRKKIKVYKVYPINTVAQYFSRLAVALLILAPMYLTFVVHMIADQVSGYIGSPEIIAQYYLFPGFIAFLSYFMVICIQLFIYDFVDIPVVNFVAVPLLSVIYHISKLDSILPFAVFSFGLTLNEESPVAKSLAFLINLSSRCRIPMD